MSGLKFKVKLPPRGGGSGSSLNEAAAPSAPSASQDQAPARSRVKIKLPAASSKGSEQTPARVPSASTSSGVKRRKQVLESDDDDEQAPEAEAASTTARRQRQRREDADYTYDGAGEQGSDEEEEEEEECFDDDDVIGGSEEDEPRGAKRAPRGRGGRARGTGTAPRPPAASRGRGRGRGRGRAAAGASSATVGRGRRGARTTRAEDPDSSDAEGLDNSELEEWSDEERVGEASRRLASHDFTHLVLKPDHPNRPLWAVPDGRILLETFSPIYKQAQDFLIAIAEPVCRPEVIHEYVLTAHSLYAAVSVGLETETIISVLNRLSKVQLDEDIKHFIRSSTENYGKVKLVLKRNKFFVESQYPAVLKQLLADPIIAQARVGAEAFAVGKALKERAAADLEHQVEAAERGEHDPEEEDEDVEELDLTHGTTKARAGPAAAPRQPLGSIGAEMVEDEEREVLSFEIDPAQVEKVKQRCLPGGLNYPLLEEYDFRNDVTNADLNIELKPHVKLRPYQEKSLAKMFGNGRARSGIIVLPCGAGKSLVGVAAVARTRKSCLCLCTSSVSVDQWKYQFQLWTNLLDHQVSRFTSEHKEPLTGASCVVISTFTMIAYSGRRSEEAEKVMQEICSREWGLILLDEVHVVPADMFRKVIGIVKAHCKLGLTATLVREDARIGDLNFLIGPKLYEANWLDLTRAGHIANVQCAEVWCPMTREFFREYLKDCNSSRRQLLYVMNPNKFMACQFLIHFHERVRGDKVIVFSDNIFALREYAMILKKPFIYGPTSHAERTRVLHAFKHDPSVNTIFLSKVGDNSLDIPEANVLIQISSHAGSRRQEAQRLGRILRAKAGKPGSGSEEEFNAFFYTLVSKDTQEMYYSTKRQQFLIDQGYSFKVITNLLDAADDSSLPLHYRDKEEQLNLLSKCLAVSEEESGIEVLQGDGDDLVKMGGRHERRPGARRNAGSMAAFSGAAGLAYMEYQAGGRKGPKVPESDKMRAMKRKIMQ